MNTPVAAKQSPARSINANLLAILLICSVLSTVFLHRYVFAVYIIEGSSMAPTLNDGDTALVNMLLRHGPVERGEIVLVRDGLDAYATKRIVGLPGERIDIKENKVFINGRLLRESYLRKNTVTRSERPTFMLGQDQYFVLGDNRPDSYDSRIYGPVPRNAVVGSYSRTFWACR
ncbi:MAG: signal peptidase I [Verrucomicrobiota bacterium]